MPAQPAPPRVQRRTKVYYPELAAAKRRARRPSPPGPDQAEAYRIFDAITGGLPMFRPRVLDAAPLSALEEIFRGRSSRST